MEPVIPTSASIYTPLQSKAAIVGKALLVAALITALAAATFFSGGAALALIGAGAATWQIGFVIIGSVASAVTLAGSVYFASKHDMFKDTGHNAEDAQNYVLDTLKSGLYAGAYGIDCFREWAIWDLIFKM